jgi:hypothetical protein
MPTPLRSISLLFLFVAFGSARTDPICQDYRTESYAHAVARVPTSGDSKDIRVRDGMAYVTVISGAVEMFDISHPRYPRFAGSFPTLDRPRDLEIRGRFAFVAEGAAGLEVFDIGRSTDITGTTPALVATYDAESSFYASRRMGGGRSSAAPLVQSLRSM